METTSFVKSTADIPACAIETGLWERFEQHCKNTPDKEACAVFRENEAPVRMTYSELIRSVEKHASCFMKAFPYLERGDRIGVVGSNRIELVLCNMMCVRIGLTTVFPPCGIQGSDIVANAVNIAKCKVLLYEGTFIKNDEIGPIFARAPSLRDAVVFGEFKGLLAESVHSWNDVFERDIPSDVLLPQPCDISGDFLIMCTSGSTGNPKLMFYSHEQYLRGFIYFWGKYSKLSSEDRVLFDRPVAYAGGTMMFWTCIAYIGATLVIQDPRMSVGKVDLAALSRLIQEENITCMVITGYVLHDMVTMKDFPKKQLQSLRVAMTGGQVLNREHAQTLNSLLPNLSLFNGYGSTEGGVIACEHDRFDGYLKIIEEIDMKIIDPTGKTVPLGVMGEACIRTQIDWKGYIKAEGQETVLDDEGWYHTGDMVIMNEKREIQVIGRASDAIKRGTILILPIRIEEVLQKHPKVAHAHVIGVPDPRLYEQICAVIVPKVSDLTEEELHMWCGENFKEDYTGLTMAPAYIKLVESVPLLAIGKVDKRALKELVMKDM